MRMIDAEELIKTIKDHHYLLRHPTLNSTDYGMFTSGAVCRSQGDQAQADAHRGVRGLDRACECVDGYGVMGMRN